MKICWPERAWLWWLVCLFTSVALGVVIGEWLKKPVSDVQAQVEVRIRFAGKPQWQAVAADICVAATLDEVKRNGGWKQYSRKFSTDKSGKAKKQLVGGRVQSLLVWPRRDTGTGGIEYEGEPVPFEVAWPEHSQEGKQIPLDITRESPLSNWHALP